jgi:hypothetical protein
MDGVTITGDLNEFCGSLRPGDVLLFEKLLRVSSTIQAGDLRPVSHSAVVVEGGGSPRMVDATLRGPDLPPVDETDLAAILDLRRRDARGEVATVRSITARRPDPAVSALVVDRARGFVAGARFSVLDLCTIAPYAFLRAGSRRLPAGFRSMLRALAEVSRASADALNRDDGPALTCAELV